MNSMEDVDVESETVLLRTDLNLPIEDGEPQPTVRFRRYMETVRELSERGARTVVLAHQGRPARDDFLSLEQHSGLMSDHMDREVGFVRCFFGSEVGESIASMEDGDVVLLENMRFLSEELQNISPERHAQDYFVNNLKRYFDLYVNDAFSAAHRSHGSIVGFNRDLDCYAGPIMESELENCRKVRDEFDSGLLVVGGEKPSDIVGMLEEMIDTVDQVLMGGIPGELALMIQGNELGEKTEWIRERGFDSKEKELRELLDEHGDKITLPEDVRSGSGNHEVGEVPEDETVWDIGETTQEKFVREIEEADSVVMKGPVGAFDEGHEDGTRAVVSAIAESDSYAVLGGGHTSSLVQRYGYELEDFSHVSIAGGAFVRFMSGEDLAAVEALRKYS
ncbi:MAG: phosphoglycerate kinase [Candidatus Nanohaloarchaea archaeon]